ncbi:MAG: hypothetical protein AAGC44_07195 [Planctomycetota bacterium]
MNRSRSLFTVHGIVLTGGLFAAGLVSAVPAFAQADGEPVELREEQPAVTTRVLDASALLPLEHEGGTLTERGQQLARAVQNAAARVLPGDEELTVDGFDQFLIVTADDQGHAVAVGVLEQLTARLDGATEEAEEPAEADDADHGEEGAPLDAAEDEAGANEPAADALLRRAMAEDPGLLHMHRLMGDLELRLQLFEEQGLGPGHMQVRQARQQLEATRRAFDERFVAWRIEKQHDRQQEIESLLALHEELLRVMQSIDNTIQARMWEMRLLVEQEGLTEDHHVVRQMRDQLNGLIQQRDLVDQARLRFERMLKAQGVAADAPEAQPQDR